MVGLPWSWKSQYAKEYMKNNPKTIRLNKDDARVQYHSWKRSKTREKFTVDMEKEGVIKALQQWRDVIIDNTHFHPKYEEAYIAIAEENRAEFEKVFINTWPITCKARNSRREKVVPEGVIDDMYEKAIAQWYVFEEKDDYIYNPDKSKPKAVIMDIDGTIARMWDRGAYDSDKVHLDTLKQQVWKIFEYYQADGYTILVFTWREDKDDCWTRTLKRLEYYNLHPDFFEIRAEWDHRCDSIVKREMFDKYCDEYCIEAVFDDRNRVVKMWRNMWLQCFQVEYWAF